MQSNIARLRSKDAKNSGSLDENVELIFGPRCSGPVNPATRIARGWRTYLSPCWA